jgi:hypothetical protein
LLRGVFIAEEIRLDDVIKTEKLIVLTEDVVVVGMGVEDDVRELERVVVVMGVVDDVRELERVVDDVRELD